MNLQNANHDILTRHTTRGDLRPLVSESHRPNTPKWIFHLICKIFPEAYEDMYWISYEAFVILSPRGKRIYRRKFVLCQAMPGRDNTFLAISTLILISPGCRHRGNLMVANLGNLLWELFSRNWLRTILNQCLCSSEIVLLTSLFSRLLMRYFFMRWRCTRWNKYIITIRKKGQKHQVVLE